MRSILLLSLVARCRETIDVCIWRMYHIEFSVFWRFSEDCRNHKLNAYLASYKISRLYVKIT